MKTVEHLSDKRIEETIKAARICFVGLVDGDMPYVLPMNFGYKDNVIYLHSAPEGRMIDIIAKNPNICITFNVGEELAYQNEDVACSYRMKSKSVVAWGKVSFQQEFSKKKEALDIIMEQYSDKIFEYSEPAIKNVQIWEVEMDKVSCKEFGTPHDKYKGDDTVKRSF